MQISLKRQSVIGWLTETIINILIIKKSYSLHNVVSVREEFWVSPWFVSHAILSLRDLSREFPY